MNPQSDDNAGDFAALALRLLDPANPIDALEARSLVEKHVREQGSGDLGEAVDG